MIGLSRLADYAVVLMAELSRHDGDALFSAQALSKATGISSATTSKLLKILLNYNLLVSLQGVKGGYRLSRIPHDISLVEIITAVDGPIHLTLCTHKKDQQCALEAHCIVKAGFTRVNLIIRQELAKVTLAEIAQPVRAKQKELA